MQTNLPFMSAYLKRSFIFMLMLFILFSCANPVAPTGGPRDETPPSIIAERSTTNFQTNFRPSSIELAFDEWVKLEQINEQIIISPPFDGYKVRLKGKKIIFDFGEKDTLRDNVTYVIQFGEAVKDLTESNPAEDLRFVFSTGPQIDSLELNGQVLDAYTAEPVKKALVLLYENLADSVFRTERPFYFGRTNESGHFNISNIRQGIYKVCALLDEDANYRFSQLNEKIAFWPKPIIISEDTTLNLTLKLFQEQIPLQLLDADSSKGGLLKLTFNQAAKSLVQIKTENDFLTSFEKDTTFIWHQLSMPWTLYLSSDTTFYDTLKVPATENGAAFNNIQLRSVATQNLNPYPRQIFILGMSSPITILDTSKVTMLADSSLQALAFDWTIDSLDARQLLIEHPFKENTTYTWTALPGAVSNLWNDANTDTLKLVWTSSWRKKFGNLHIQFTTNEPGDTYFVKVLQKGKKAVATYILQGELSYEKNVRGIPPGDYQLEIIQDKNANGRWDTGNYDALLQPEKVIIHPLEKLRANWDLEVEVALADFEKE